MKAAAQQLPGSLCEPLTDHVPAVARTNASVETGGAQAARKLR